MLNPLRKSEVIFHNAHGINIEPDAKFSYKLEADLKWPDFHYLVYTIRYGSCETVIIVGKSLKALERRIKRMKIRTNPRLLEFVVTGPEGKIEHFTRPYA